MAFVFPKNRTTIFQIVSHTLTIWKIVVQALKPFLPKNRYSEEAHFSFSILHYPLNT